MADQETLSQYQQVIRKLSDQIVLAQRPIRILDSLKWNQNVENYFFAHKCKKLPKIDQEWYLKNNPLSFDPKKKIDEFLTAYSGKSYIIW